MIEFDLKEDLKIKEADATEYGMEYTIEASCTETASGKVSDLQNLFAICKFD